MHIQRVISLLNMAEIVLLHVEGISIEMANRGQADPPYHNEAYLPVDEELGNGLHEDEEGEEFDPWALPELQDLGPKWSELDGCGKVKRVALAVGKVILLLGLLYVFICSLDFLSSAFRLLGGKAAGEAFASNKILSNPVAGLMIGILATVLVQSSSTTTSIVVSMVAAQILDVELAIPIVMGANIGTSVTNTIVSLAQAAERNEFRRAFAGATVHDIFNWLSVLIFLPLEVITHFLLHLTGEIIDVLPVTRKKGTNKKLLKKLTEPFTKLIIQFYNDIALGDESAESKSLIKDCSPKEVTEAVNKTLNGTTYLENVTTIEPALCKFLFHGTSLSDTEVGIIILVLSIGLLCICLVSIVKVLHSMLRGQMEKIIKKTVNADFPGPFKHLTGYLAILVGAGLTILVQSSSIFASALTPLIGVGVVTIERAFPLTLGSNIGITATGILAALASSSNLDKALQIAFCHLFFNISGILVWYPIPCLRKVPIGFAKLLGKKAADHRWFAIAYLMFGFFLLPAAVFGLSLAWWKVPFGVAAPLLLLFMLTVFGMIFGRKAPGHLSGFFLLVIRFFQLV